MKISLEMLKDYLYSKGIRVTVREKRKHFFAGIRMLDKNNHPTPEYLYMIPQLTEIAEIPGLSETVCFYSRPDIRILSDQDAIYPEEIYDCSVLWNTTLEAFEYYHGYERKFLELLDHKEPLQEAVDLMSAMLGNPAYMVDASFKVLAMDMSDELPLLSINWKRIRNLGYLPVNVVSELFLDSNWTAITCDTGAVITSTRQFSVPFITYHLYEKNKITGYFFVTGILRKIRSSDLDIVNVFGIYLLKIWKSDEKFSLIHGEYYEHFLQDMLDSRIQDQEFIEQQMESLGWKYQDHYCILVLHAQEKDQQYYEFISGRIRILRSGKSLHYHKYLVYILPVHDRNKFADDIQSIQKTLNQIHSPAGLSDIFYRFERLHHYFIQAESALHYGEQTAKGCLLHQYKDYCMKHLLENCGQQESLLSCVHPGIFMLMSQEQQARTALVETLYQFLRHNQNLVFTSKILNVHRNTLVYRLNRIKEIIGEEFQNPDVCNRLILSVEIVRFLSDDL